MNFHKIILWIFSFSLNNFLFNYLNIIFFKFDFVIYLNAFLLFSSRQIKLIFLFMINSIKNSFLMLKLFSSYSSYLCFFSFNKKVLIILLLNDHFCWNLLSFVHLWSFDLRNFCVSSWIKISIRLERHTNISTLLEIIFTLNFFKVHIVCLFSTQYLILVVNCRWLLSHSILFWS